MVTLTSVAFNKDYIQALADILLEESVDLNYDMSAKTVVFAGKRPALFLKRELARRFGQAFIPPRCVSVDDLVKEINEQDLEPIKDLDAIYRIYLIAKEHVPSILKNSKNFAAFMPWAKEVRNFIDQLDLEMVSDKSLQQVEIAAAIGYDVPDKINELLKHIVIIRQKYHQYLEEQSLSSRALDYQKAAQRAKNYAQKSGQKFYFCNFYYLSRSEEKLLMSIANVVDAQYIFHGNPQQWLGLKEFEKQFKTSIKYEHGEVESNIEYHECFDRHAEVVRVREIIKKISDREQTLLLMPDEESLVPMLSELSAHVDEFNVSMGYPLWRSSLFSLIMLLFELTLSKKNNKLYSKDYLRVITHPLIKNLEHAQSNENSSALTRIVIHKLEEFILGKESSDIAGAAFIDLEDIEGLNDIFDRAAETTGTTEVSILRDIIRFIHDQIIRPWFKLESLADFTVILRGLMQVLLDNANIDRYPINRKMLENLFDLCEQMSDLEFSTIKFDADQIYLVVKEVLKSQKVSFVGSPLQGMQILGLFESRSLNFKNVIIMDLNEGTLPKIQNTQPLIPAEVMSALGLRRVVHEEEIQRYNFMRLISAADKVDLVFVDSDQKTRSRFVEMLLWEEEKKQLKFDISSFSQTAFNVDVSIKEELVHKTPEMIEYMKNTMTHSASSIKTYLDCPMCFYYRYVLNLYEKEDFYDEPDARHIGTFIHDLLEDSYRPLLGKKLLIDDNFISDFFRLFDQRFEIYMQRNMKSEGFLLKRIMEYRLRNFLEYEKTRNVRELLSLEDAVYDKLRFSFGELKFVTKMDRIEDIDGSLLILDYKTGKADIKSKKRNGHIIDQSSRELIKQTVGSFQLPLYILMAQKHFDNPLINAGLYDLKAAKINFLFDEFSDSNQEIIDDYYTALESVLSEMLDPKVPFYVDSSFEHNCI